MTDDELARSVVAELVWDPKVDSEAIAVSADDGTVTLRGTVGSFRQKVEAQRAAQRVHGVEFVNNELDVRFLNQRRRDDADLRGDVLQALMLDAVVPTTVDADVKDGMVRLTGTASWHHQRDEAEFVAGNVFGVTGVRNEILLAGSIPDADHVKGTIEGALESAAKLEADDIDVKTIGGTVRLTGRVGSWVEHDAVVAAVWAAPGVTAIDDRLEVRQ
jgi:osmotically-inducible protein OsmY